jgi:D-arabinose 5-phosphate isomerase GutQ
MSLSDSDPMTRSVVPIITISTSIGNAVIATAKRQEAACGRYADIHIAPPMRMSKLCTCWVRATASPPMALIVQGQDDLCIVIAFARTT